MERLYTREELQQRNRRDNAAIIIDNVVYDVVRWLEEHPGGDEVLLARAGGDASQCFRDVGHSEEAQALRQRFRIGQVVPEQRWEVPEPARAEPADEPAAGALLRAAGPPLLAAALALLAYVYLL